MQQRSFRYIFLAVLAGILLLILLAVSCGTVQKWLWMRQLGYTVIFWRLLSMQWTLAAVAFLAALAATWLNLHVAARVIERIGLPVEDANIMIFPVKGGNRLAPGILKALALLAAGLVAVVLAATFYAEWDTYLRFRWGGAVGLADPIYGKDIGFYLFSLPFDQLIQNSLSGLAAVNLIAVVVAYNYFGVIQRGWRNWVRQDRQAFNHLAVLVIVLLASWAWGYFLDRYDLLNEQTGIVYGVGYTAYHVTRISLWVMVVAALVLGVMGVVSITLRRSRVLLVLCAGSFAVLYVAVVILLPSLIQKYKVAPSELELETPFLKHNIEFTRKAFQLDRIQEQTYPGLKDLTLKDIAANQDTIDNIRLWDWRPILETYRQTQEIRLYYQFYNVDVGRYHLPSGYHQVTLSARELAAQLPPKARTWVNQYLQFTHGYGLVMNFVAKKTPEGLPDYIAENIPPQSKQGVKVVQPAIYYGESSPGYRIVSTNVKEFDYPKGDKNVYTSYAGTGGIPLDAWWKRLLFSWTQSDINILLSSYVEPRSRIQIWRRVRERVARIAPFLKQDQDPYLVLSDGKLYWIEDLYTVSDRFPYAQPYEKAFDRINYIRNSAKAIVDVYNGSVDFYVMDPRDPVLKAYRKAFPGVFKDLEALPADLKAHLRYPEDLFAIQADLYRTYHMVNPQVFYNQEDLWSFPQEKYAGQAVGVEPYYILMRLPGAKQLQYLLMTPFTPQKKDNMISWMAAKCDFPEYGQLLLYQLPKERLIYGPIQVEAMIDQNTRISEQLSLWDQRGSRVIRGNLIVIPIENAFLYVEPVYLTAEGINIPQLKRVIAVYGDQVEMAPTLETAIAAVFGAAQPEETETKAAAAPVQNEVLKRAREVFQEIQKNLQEGHWGDYGKAMETLKTILEPPPAGPSK
jgi:uncharacterized protein